MYPIIKQLRSDESNTQSSIIVVNLAYYVPMVTAKTPGHNDGSLFTAICDRPREIAYKENFAQLQYRKTLYLVYSKSQVGVCHKDLRLQTYSGTATNSHFTLCEIKLRCEVKRGCEIKEP